MSTMTNLGWNLIISQPIQFAEIITGFVPQFLPYVELAFFRKISLLVGKAYCVNIC